jgi:hypothetical protein
VEEDLHLTDFHVPAIKGIEQRDALVGLATSLIKLGLISGESFTPEERIPISSDEKAFIESGLLSTCVVNFYFKLANHWEKQRIKQQLQSHLEKLR